MYASYYDYIGTSRIVPLHLYEERLSSMQKHMLLVFLWFAITFSQGAFLHVHQVFQIYSTNTTYTILAYSKAAPPHTPIINYTPTNIQTLSLSLIFCNRRDI